MSVTTDAATAMIEQAMILREAKYYSEQEPTNFNPEKLMTVSIREQLYYLLRDETKDFQDWGARFWGYKDLMLDMLTLIASPGVLKKLPEGSQKNAGKMLHSLIEFFEMADHDDTHALLDSEMMQHAEDEDNATERILQRYDYSLLNTGKGGAGFFHDIEREMNWKQKVDHYYKKHYTKNE